MKLYCIPGGGTPSSVFFKWKAALKGKAEVVILDHKDRGRAAAADTWEAAKRLYKLLCGETEPYALLSSCTGTMIAYELYRLMADNGKRLPDKFIAFSALAPDTRYYAGSRYISEMNRGAIYSVYRGLFSDELFAAPDEAAEKCCRYLLDNSTAEAAALPELSLILDGDEFEQKAMLDFANNTIITLTEDWSAAASYNLTEKIVMNCDVLLIRGSSDELVTPQEALRWQDFTSKELTVLEIGGDHNIITRNTGSCIAIVAENI